MNRHMLGASVEMEALVYLQKIGYELIDQNYRLPDGELDLIMRDGDTLVIVEVRSSVRDLARSSVGNTKRKKLVMLGERYMLDVDWVKKIRFDVIVKERDRCIKHIKRAFDLNDIV